MRITVANLKGGTAKTTTAMFLAIGLNQSGRTLLVDADPQRSALAWSEMAEDFPVPVISWPTRDLAKRVQQVVGDFEHVVIDTPPGHDGVVRQALMVSDLLIVPIRPSLGEINRLEPTFDLAAEVEAINPVDVRVLLTQVRDTNSAREIRDLLEELQLPRFQTEIRLWEAYSTAYGTVPADLAQYKYVLAELQASILVAKARQEVLSS